MNWIRRFFGAPDTPSAETSAGESSTTDPFGPDFQQRLEMLALLSRKLDRGKLRNEIVKRHRGTGIEFADHRDYQPGDDPRLIDWNATERLGRLLLRINEEYEDRRTYVLLDESASMRYPNDQTFERAQQIAAALGYLALCRFDRVLVGAFHDRDFSHAPIGRGTGRILTILRFLRARRAQGETHFETMARKFIARHPRPGVVYLISDGHDSDNLKYALDSLRYARHLVHWIHVIPSAPSITVARGDVTLVDSETGATLELTLTTAVQRTLEKTNATRRLELEKHCRVRQIFYHAAPTHESFERIVLALLRAITPTQQRSVEP